MDYEFRVVVEKVSVTSQRNSLAIANYVDSVKWLVWHGNAAADLRKLRLIQHSIRDHAQRAKIQRLHD